MILVDSNIWIDLIERDPVWFEWSLAQTQRARESKLVAINPVIYAELAPTFDSAQPLLDFIRASKAVMKPLSPQCAYLAGRAFLDYRQRKGVKTGVLPDFFIGAQAQTEGWKILTRDAGRYKTCFPQVKLICP